MESVLNWDIYDLIIFLPVKSIVNCRSLNKILLDELPRLAISLICHVKLIGMDTGNHNDCKQEANLLRKINIFLPRLENPQISYSLFYIS